MLVIIQPIQASEDCSSLSGTAKGNCLVTLTAELEGKINESRGQQKTLAAAISYLNSRMALTQAQIEQTKNEMEILEDEITILSVKIERLDINLTDVSRLLISRIGATYKRNRIKPFYLFFDSGGFADFFGRLKYLQAVQQNDRQILLELQNTRDSHQEQKDLKQEKQDELVSLQQKLAQQNNALNQQKASKQELLRQTQNDEQRYQQLLAAARAEMVAINAIIAGKGTENKVGHVNEGDKIASIIQGNSCNSSGTHLHFMITNNSLVKNPFDYLRSINYVNCSGPGECSTADSFNPHGSWSWPINPRVRFSQGYGDTWAIHNTWVGQIYNFHNGIDINSESSSVVKAIKAGDLYQGSYVGIAGCSLHYVRLEHNQDNLNSYYLHVNYF